MANSMYEDGLKMSRRMEPCVQGFKDMFTLGYSGIDKYKPTDFYDESFMKELEKSGFIDSLIAQPNNDKRITVRAAVYDRRQCSKIRDRRRS